MHLFFFKGKYSVIYLFTLFYIVNLNILAQEKHDGKVLFNHNVKSDSTKKESSVKDYISLYQSFISGARGSECAMYPSCSNYGLKVFNEKPFYEAIVLTADRLIRCSHDRKYYDETFAYGNKASMLDFPPYAEAPYNLIYKQKQYFYTDNLKSTNKEDSCKLLINYLINQNDYQGALSEINKALFYYKKCDSKIYINKLLCYEALDRGEDGIYDYKVKFPQYIQKDPNVILKVSKLYFNINNNEEALSILNNIDSATDTVTLYKKHTLQGLIETKLGHYNEAKHSFQQSLLAGYNNEIQKKNIQLVDQLSQMKTKKPILAKLFSIVPGGGYLYTNEIQNAATSFIINSLLAYATYTSIKSKNYGVAGLMGVFSVSFYCGNILGAGNSAKKYNKYQINKTTKKILYQNQISNY